MSRRLRIIVPLILLVMMLMRIIWLNLRSYEPQFSPSTLAAVHLYVARGGSCLYSDDGGELAPLGVRQLEGETKVTLSPAMVLAAQRFCSDARFTVDDWLKWNQALILVTVFFSVLAVRFLTSSWTVAIITGTVLLSRGRMLGSIEVLGPDIPIACLLAVWLASIAHHLRTGSILSAIAAGLTAAALAVLDAAFLALVLPVPMVIVTILLIRPILMRPLVQRLRVVRDRLADWQDASAANNIVLRLTGAFHWLVGPAREEPVDRLDPSFAGGLLFRTIDVPYALWLYRDGRWSKALSQWLGLALLALLVLVSVETFTGARQVVTDVSTLAASSSFSIATWWRAVNTPLDYHLLASLLVIVLCCVQSPADGLISFQESMFILFAALSSVATAAFLFDVRASFLIAPLQDGGGAYTLSDALEWRRVAVWFEPVVLAAGVASVYNLIKVFESRRQRRLMAAARS